MIDDDKSFYSISEVSKALNLPNHVLRFWEEKFSQISPLKSNGRRYYRKDDIKFLKLVQDLLYNQGHTIKGAQKHLASKEIDFTQNANKLYLKGDNNFYKLQLLIEKLYKLKSKLQSETN